MPGIAPDAMAAAPCVGDGRCRRTADIDRPCRAAQRRLTRRRGVGDELLLRGLRWPCGAAASRTRTTAARPAPTRCRAATWSRERRPDLAYVYLQALRLYRFSGDLSGLGALTSEGRCVTCINRADSASGEFASIPCRVPRPWSHRTTSDDTGYCMTRGSGAETATGRMSSREFIFLRNIICSVMHWR